MAANSSFDLVSLDFDQNKNSLKNFLKSQDVFKDFDFEGSNINILIDVLSYNTFINSFYLNMIAGESFLDSAQMKDSIVSHAKELNYLPRSKKSARVPLEPFTITANKELTTLFIPKGTQFSGTVKGVGRDFVTDSVYINNTPTITNNTAVFTIGKRISPSDGTASYLQNPLMIYQGKYLKDTFIVDYTIENQRFLLSDTSIDTDSISVVVTEDSGATEINYLYSSTLLDVKNIDPRFFLQAAENDKYEIVFGDDIIGRRPKNGATITVEYRSTEGEDGNGVLVFSLNTNVVEYSGGSLVGTTNKITASLNYSGGSYGGSNAESIDQIRYKAPRYFQTQERAVTTSDYRILLQNAFPEISAIAVFGGETFDPPLYGKVYVSVQLKDVDGLPDSKRIEYLDYMSNRSPLSIEPVFISPEKLYYKLTSVVNYNINVTTYKVDQIKASVLNAIITFNDTYLNDFNVKFRMSKLVAAIDNSDQSIVSNQTEILIYKKIIPFLAVSQNIIIKFGVPLFIKGPYLGLTHPIIDIHAVSSSMFKYNGLDCHIEDDGDGLLRIVTSVGDNHSYVKNIGTVDYENGIVKINNFNIESISGSELRIYGLPRYHDISVVGNNIFTLGIDELDITINTVRE